MSFNSIGFIGVGVMGEPICRHLATKSGLPVLAADLQKAPLERLSNHGVQPSKISKIIEKTDLVFISMPSGEALEQLMYGNPQQEGVYCRSRAGQWVIDLSTSPVSLTRKIAQDLNKKGVVFIDAPVMRTRQAAEEGTLAVPVGATDKQFKTIEPLIRMFATDVHHVGEIGAGQIVKILNNMVLYETVLALAEARAIGARAGVDPERLFQALSTGSADSFALRNHGLKSIVPQDFPERAFPVTYAKKDIEYAVDLAQEVGINATGAKNLIACFDKAIEQGHGNKYAPAINLVFESS